jgi:hypothetical protein
MKLNVNACKLVTYLLKMVLTQVMNKYLVK